MRSRLIYPTGIIVLMSFLIPLCVFSETEEIEQLRQAAEAGDSKAQYTLGKFFAKAVVVEQDFKEAEKWLRMAANQENANAELYLAYVYWESHPDEPSREEAWKWIDSATIAFSKGAEKDHPEVQTIAEWMYQLGRKTKAKFLKGLVVGNDYESMQAFNWMYRAACLNHNEARNIVFENAQEGDLLAMTLFAEMFFHGKGRIQNFKKAAFWYKKAASKGYPEAQFRLGVMYFKGLHYKQDYEQAAKWLRGSIIGRKTQPEAVRQLSTACYFLGLIYYDGKNFEKDHEKAAKYLAVPATAGNVDAQFLLGLIYSRGEGIEKDFIQSYKWLKIADERGHNKAGKYTILLSKNISPEEIAEAKKLAEEWLEKHKEGM